VYIRVYMTTLLKPNQQLQLLRFGDVQRAQRN
jgi:hypothetical protein